MPLIVLHVLSSASFFIPQKHVHTYVVDFMFYHVCFPIKLWKSKVNKIKVYQNFMFILLLHLETWLICMVKTAMMCVIINNPFPENGAILMNGC